MATTIQPTFQFDSSDLSPRAAVSAWREVMSATHAVTLDELATGFHVDARVWLVGPVLVSSGRFSAQTFSRSRQQARRDGLDHYALFVQGDGARSIQTGSGGMMRPGDVLFYDLAQDVASTATAGSSGTLYLPREVVADAVPAASNMHGTILRNGAAHIVGGHIHALAGNLVATPVDAIPRLASATVDLALGCIGAAFDRRAHAGASPLARAVRRDLDRYIHDHLGDPGLTPDVLAAHVGISRATLYRLFDADGGVAHYIKERRLDHVRAILVANQDPRSLARLAEDTGFSSPGHLSREFRRRFGLRPSDLRGPHIPPDVPPDGSPNALDGVFRMIQA